MAQGSMAGTTMEQQFPNLTIQFILSLSAQQLTVNDESAGRLDHDPAGGGVEGPARPVKLLIND